MTKRKKRVCVGWGILMWPKSSRPYLSVYVPVCDTRIEAIETYETRFGVGHYQLKREQGKAIAKKIMVEV